MTARKHESYQYEWAASIAPQQRKVDLMYVALEMIMGTQSALLMSYLLKCETHLHNTATLVCSTRSMREQINYDLKKRSPELFKKHRRAKSLADIELHTAVAAILRSLLPMFTATDQRIMKEIISDCVGMAFTCELLNQIEDEDEKNNA